MRTDSIFHCTNNVDIHAVCWGDSTLPPLLALHGWLDNAASFDTLAPLIKCHHVIAIDLPGHGLSSQLPSAFDYMMPNQLHWLHELVQLLGVSSLALLGHSMGAGIASLYAACFPDTIKHFITLDMLGPLSRSASQTTQGLAQSVLSVSQQRTDLRHYAHIEAMIHRRAVLNNLSADCIAPIVRRGITKTNQGYQWRFDPRLLNTSPICFTGSQIEDLLSHISCPTLAVMTAHNEPLQSIIDKRFKCLPVGTRFSIEASHHLHLDKPEETAQIINEWVASLRVN